MDLSKLINKDKPVETAVRIAVSLVYAVFYPFLLYGNKTLSYTYVFIPVLVYFAVFFVTLFWAKINWKEVWGWIYAVLISLFLMIGKDVSRDYHVEMVSFRFIISLVLSIPAIYMLTAFLFARFDYVSGKKEKEKECRLYKLLSKPVFLFCLFTVSMIPIFLGTYPGTLSGDTSFEYYELIGGNVSRTFPVLHTLLFGGTVAIVEKLTGSINTGVAIFAFGQILIFAGMFTYAVRFLQIRKAPRKATYFLVATLIINPITQLFCKDVVRDTLFIAAVFCVSFVMFVSLFEGDRLIRKPMKLAGIFLLCFATIYLRAFAKLFYIIALILLILFVVFVKKDKKIRLAMAGLFIGVLVLSSVFDKAFVNRVTQPVSDFPGVSSSGIREYLCVVIEQINYVFYTHGDMVSEEEIDIMSEVMDRDLLLNHYNAKCVDLIKYYFDNDAFKANPGRYLSIWFKYLKIMPAEYLDVFFTLNTEAWYPDTIFEGYYDIMGTNVYYQPGDTIIAWERSFIPIVRVIENKISYEITFQKIPVINLLFSPAFMLYVILFGLFYLISRKRGEAVILLPALILHFGFFIGPMICLRYFMASFWIAPVSIALCMSGPITEENNKK